MNELGPDTWVTQKNIQDENNSVKYLYAVYWALQTLTTVGYGDIPADTNEEKIVCIFWMVFGVGFYSFTIGNLSSFITTIDAKGAQLRAKIQTIEEFARKHELPKDLEIRMKSLTTNQNEVTKHDQKKLLQELPSSLRAEVVNHIHADIIKNITFFKDKGAEFLYSALPLVKRFNLPPKEVLYKEGDPAEEVYFIFKGQIKLCNKEKVAFRTYKDGNMFGENEVVYKEARDSTAISMNECQLLVMSKFDFKKLMEEHPKEGRKIKINALLRRERHKKDKVKLKERTKILNKSKPKKKHHKDKINKKNFKRKGGKDHDNETNSIVSNSSNEFERLISKRSGTAIRSSSQSLAKYRSYHLRLNTNRNSSVKNSDKDNKSPLLHPPNKKSSGFASRSNSKEFRSNTAEHQNKDLKVEEADKSEKSPGRKDLAQPIKMDTLKVDKFDKRQDKKLEENKKTDDLQDKNAVTPFEDEEIQGNKGKKKPTAKKSSKKLKNNVKAKDEKSPNNHIDLKYSKDQVEDTLGTDYEASSDEEIMDDEYDDEGEEEEESLDELLFLEAVASLNENISMLTINSTEIFNSFQSLVKETNTLSSTLQEFSRQLKQVSTEQENNISKEIKNLDL